MWTDIGLAMLQETYKNCIDHNFNFVFKHKETLVLFPNFSALYLFTMGHFFYVFFEKDTYLTYILYATLKSYVAC